MAPQASKKCGLLFPDHQQIGCCTSNGIDSDKVLGTFFVLTIPLLPLQRSYRAEKTLVTPFACFHVLRTLELD